MNNTLLNMNPEAAKVFADWFGTEDINFVYCKAVDGPDERPWTYRAVIFSNETYYCVRVFLTGDNYVISQDDNFAVPGISWHDAEEINAVIPKLMKFAVKGV